MPLFEKRSKARVISDLNFINSCAEGLELIKESGRQCVKLMPDLFHMNIEDASLREAFESARDFRSEFHQFLRGRSGIDQRKWTAMRKADARSLSYEHRRCLSSRSVRKRA